MQRSIPYTVFLLAMVLLLVAASTPPGPTATAQEERTYTFSTGLTVQVPSGWQLDADPLARNYVLLTNGEQLLAVQLLTVAEQAELATPGDIAGLMPAVFPEALGEIVIATVNLREQRVAADRVVQRYAYGRSGVVYASATRSGDILFVLNPRSNPRNDTAVLGLYASMQEPGTADAHATPAEGNSMATAAPLQTATPPTTPTTPDRATPTREPTPTRTPSPTPSVARTDDTPFALPTPRIVTLSSHRFSEGTRLRYPAGWSLTVNAQVRDLVVFEIGTALLYADLYREFDFLDLGLSGVGAVMDYSYVPYSADAGFDATAVRTFSPPGSNATLRYWRYIDGGFSGTQLAAELPNGSILVMDAFDVAPNSDTEAIAFAMLLDAAGDASLLQAMLRVRTTDN